MIFELPLTEDEGNTLSNALVLAAERFDENVKLLNTDQSLMTSSAAKSLAEQFALQARQTRALNERLMEVLYG